MTGEQNWRQEVDALDYLGGQQKKVAVADRRPVIRSAKDLVGPGLGPSAVRLLDFNDALATFNGFFSAVDGAANAPQPSGKFVGFVAMDSEFGGVQRFVDMTSGLEYRRRFDRYPGDANAIQWGAWVSEGGNATTRVSNFNTAVTNGYYSALSGAANAPLTGNFTGYVVRDDSVGGYQRFTDLATGLEWTRRFTLSGGSPVWGAWSSDAPEYRYGRAAVTCDSSGNAIVPHTLGKVPTFDVVSLATSNFYAATVGQTAANLTVNVRNVTTGAVLVGNVTIKWFVL